MLAEACQTADLVDRLAEQLATEHLIVEGSRGQMVYGESISLLRPWVINHIQTPSDHMNVGDTFYENIQIAAH